MQQFVHHQSLILCPICPIKSIRIDVNSETAERSPGVDIRPDGEDIAYARVADATGCHIRRVLSIPVTLRSRPDTCINGICFLDRHLFLSAIAEIHALCLAH